ncbi:MAG: AAA family ATPase [Clostridia bacterium]|nr:AAA family ATPase [Clostridia bacterium]
MLEEYLPQKMCLWIERYKGTVTDVTLSVNENMYLTVIGSIVDTDCFVTEQDFQNILTSLCRGSLYANQSTLKTGYITLENGYRVGMTGTAVTERDGTISHLRCIKSVNIRISRFIQGASGKIIDHIRNDGRVFNTVIIAPPGAGKTTILRDLAIRLGEDFKVGIADEREEIVPCGSSFRHTFVMKGARKHDCMLSMLRSMAPQVILTDEIGTKEDEMAIISLINSGVKVICTAHGYSERDFFERACFKEEKIDKLFERIVVLSSRHGPGTIEKIIHTKERAHD